MPFFLAILFSAWVGGLRPGLLATALATVFGAFFLLAPKYSLLIDSSSDRLQLAFFIATGIGICLAYESLHTSRRRSEARLIALEQAILERQQAETALRENERELADFFDNASVGLHWVNGDGIILRVNQTELDLLGYKREEYIGHSISKFHSEKNVIEDMLQRLTRGETLINYEARLKHRDGSIRRVLINSNALFREGKFIHSRCFTRDITQWTEQQTALERSEARLRRVFESNVVGMIRWDLDRSLILEANAEFLRMTDYTLEDVSAGRLNFRELTPPEWTSRNEVGIQTIRENGFAAPYEKEYYRKDGSRVAFIIADTRFDDSTSEGMSFLIDISESKKTQEKMRTSEISYRRIFEAAQDGILLIDPESRKIIDANPFITQLLGYSLEDLVGKELWQIGLFKDEKACAAAIREILDEQHIRCDSLSVDTLDGKRLLVEFASNLYSEDDHSVIQCSVRDITERKRMEEELRHQSAELLDADRRKNEFLATLAHELRNPLAPIRNGLQLMRMAASSGDESEHARDMMERQLTQMVRLVDDLMDVSRISRGKIELRKETISLLDVLNSAIETSRPLIENMGHHLSVTFPEHPILVEADMTRLAQVFLNLLNNAAKYNEPNGKIWLSAHRHSEGVVVSVRDSGIGIAADQMPHIFEMFSQVDQSLERSQGGLGIGLSLVKELVALHGGFVEAKSDGMGMGSEFKVLLPIINDPPPPKQNALAKNLADCNSALRILIVDDNRDSATSLAMLLKKMGNDTRSAYDGQEAIQIANEFQPEVILLDIGLPKLNGYEVCRRIRKEPALDQVVIIAQTGWGQEGDRQRTSDAGFDHHMVKPLDTAALVKLLTEIKSRPMATHSKILGTA